MFIYLNMSLLNHHGIDTRGVPRALQDRTLIGDTIAREALHIKECLYLFLLHFLEAQTRRVSFLLQLGQVLVVHSRLLSMGELEYSGDVNQVVVLRHLRKSTREPLKTILRVGVYYEALLEKHLYEKVDVESGMVVSGAVVHVGASSLFLRDDH